MVQANQAPVTASGKIKLSFADMIKHLDNKKVGFNIISKTKARKMLEESNYFYKITAYRKNFSKNAKGEYINLEFAYLYDLATIDMRLRYIVLQMCLDIEHSVKTKVLADITNDRSEDGYKIVDDFLAHERRKLDDYMNPMKDSSHYNNGLYTKHHKKCPVWVLFEIIPFGGFVKFFEFYYVYKNKPKKYADLYEVLKYVKNVRNSAAHNSPLILDIVATNQITGPIARPVTTFVGNIKTISKDVRRKRLSNRKIHDITALLFVYDKYVTSQPMKKVRYDDVDGLLKRSTRLKAEYSKHFSLVSVYNYFKKIVDFLKSTV
ncbi:Abi family protein [Neobacillus notoginsengisoli]|uniref:Abi family protein n=1 Tax=Neobacillus notoginsengisoli TaxID=1578198 RepID=UPI001314DA83|nr:Abi family protein [Neobacillus notoginsengisoli]